MLLMDWDWIFLSNIPGVSFWKPLHIYQSKYNWELGMLVHWKLEEENSRGVEDLITLWKLPLHSCYCSFLIPSSPLELRGSLSCSMRLISLLSQLPQVLHCSSWSTSLLNPGGSAYPIPLYFIPFLCPKYCLSLIKFSKVCNATVKAIYSQIGVKFWER